MRLRVYSLVCANTLLCAFIVVCANTLLDMDVINYTCVAAFLLQL